jgi:transposase InsO family protein
MTLDDRIQGLRLRVMARARVLGSVSAACREAGVSRTLYYRWRRRLERYGADGLHPRRRQTRPGRKSEVAPEVERQVVAWALAWPSWGCGRLAAQLARLGIARLAPSTVQRVLRRAGLARRRERLAVLEHHAARTVGLLTERTRRALWRARYGRTRHVAASRPGELVCLDTFYVGQLKGVGKVWQVTACDAACSFGVARLIPALTAAAAAAFLREVLVPLYQRAGWPLTRVLTDGGSEFKADFDLACGELGIRHTRTKPRHAWTNGFVERLQQTLLAEHWRIQFRRRYFTRLAQLETSLQGFLRFYNGDRPHQGYRLRGRTPASVFWGAVPPEE